MQAHPSSKNKSVLRSRQANGTPPLCSMGEQKLEFELHCRAACTSRCPPAHLSRLCAARRLRSPVKLAYSGGRVPRSLLLLTSSNCKFCNAAQVGGRVPLQQQRGAQGELRAGRRTSAVRAYVSWLSCKDKDSSPLKLPNSCGSVPSKLLLLHARHAGAVVTSACGEEARHGCHSPKPQVAETWVLGQQFRHRAAAWTRHGRAAHAGLPGVWAAHAARTSAGIRASSASGGSASARA